MISPLKNSISIPKNSIFRHLKIRLQFKVPHEQFPRTPRGGGRLHDDPVAAPASRHAHECGISCVFKQVFSQPGSEDGLPRWAANVVLSTPYTLSWECLIVSDSSMTSLKVFLRRSSWWAPAWRTGEMMAARTGWTNSSATSRTRLFPNSGGVARWLPVAVPCAD